MNIFKTTRYVINQLINQLTNLSLKILESVRYIPKSMADFIESFINFYCNNYYPTILAVPSRLQ